MVESTCEVSITAPGVFHCRPWSWNLTPWPYRCQNATWCLTWARRCETSRRSWSNSHGFSDDAILSRFLNHVTNNGENRQGDLLWPSTSRCEHGPCSFSIVKVVGKDRGFYFGYFFYLPGKIISEMLGNGAVEPMPRFLSSAHWMLFFSHFIGDRSCCLQSFTLTHKPCLLLQAVGCFKKLFRKCAESYFPRVPRVFIIVSNDLQRSLLSCVYVLRERL